MNECTRRNNCVLIERVSGHFPFDVLGLMLYSDTTHGLCFSIRLTWEYNREQVREEE